MSSLTSDKPISPPDGHAPSSTPEPVAAPGSAGFQAKYVARDIQAGIICGAMAIPLSTGIAMMSEYPIKVALATVVFACFIGWINSFFRPGNYIGVPGLPQVLRLLWPWAFSRSASKIWRSVFSLPRPYKPWFGSSTGNGT